MPYGFPSGKDLVEQICAATLPHVVSSRTGMAKSLEMNQITKLFHSQFGTNTTEEFGNALYLSQKPSIDTFLEHRKKFIDIGKFAIALLILDKEIKDNIISFESRGKGCYQYLFNTLNTSWEGFATNKVSFITFNYDRSLEQYMYISLKNSYGKTDEECSELLSSIPIVHVHGSLGALRWQRKDGIQYGQLQYYYAHHSKWLLGFMSLASKQIKVITEDQAQSEEFQTAVNFLLNAERIYFLGFGYNAVNLQRLRLLDVPKVKENLKFKSEIIPLRGTGLNLEDAEKNSIHDKWGIRILDTSSDCLQFLRKYALLD